MNKSRSQRPRPEAAKKDVGKASAVSRLSYLSLRFKIGEPSYRPLLFEVVLQDELALLRTIETACGSSLSRAPENTPRPAALCFSPRLLVGLPRRFLRAGRGWFPVTLYLQMPQGCESWEAVVRDCTLGQYVRFPRSARPSHPLRQQSLASNPSEYDKAPKVKAFGNRVRAGV